MRILLISLAFALYSLSPALADDVIQRYVPNAQKVGAGRYVFVFLDVYDATLYAPKGQWDAHAPYALSLRYLRDVDGDDIADRAVEEMKGQGYADNVKLTAWHAKMLEIFPDVDEGSELEAVFIPGKSIDFYHNGKPIGSIKDAEFCEHFSAIWLSDKTSEPGLRRKLLGLL